MNIFELLTEVLSIKEDSNPFYRFENKDGKVWLMPVRRLRTAMNLYQPSGRNGKLLKRWFPLLHQVPILKRMLHIETTRCSLDNDLYDKLCEVFVTDELEFSVFCGTPCQHQKLTIQISVGKRILGYCKVSNHPDVISLFHKEGEFLKQLERIGINNVPRILFVGEWRSGIHLLVQNTNKTCHSQIIHKWETLHEEFLENLITKTKQVLPFEETDYYRNLSKLLEHIEWLPSEEARALLGNAIDKVFMKYKGQMVAYGAYHADFTPWNMFEEQGKLFVFDWEYAQMTYPPMLDRYHFFTQTAIFEKHWQAKEIMEYTQSAEGNWIDAIAYKLYLLDVIARFTIREKGNISGDVAHSMNIWIELLKRL